IMGCVEHIYKNELTKMNYYKSKFSHSGCRRVRYSLLQLKCYHQIEKDMKGRLEIFMNKYINISSSKELRKIWISNWCLISTTCIYMRISNSKILISQNSQS
ncbi:MAG: hypothetical protein M3Y25_00720, partial [Thermoproteota archaeon]|nr:hypothetical protein [Thermoproteota archaeon]